VSSGVWAVVVFVLAFGVSGLIAFSVFHQLARKPKTLTEYNEAVGALYQAHPIDLQLYCRSCGSALVTATLQTGFDAYTGKPTFGHFRKCPNKVLTANGGHEQPDCHVRGASAPSEGLHTHDPAEADTACPACIDVMIRDGVIDDAAAKKLYAAAGITNNYTMPQGFLNLRTP
jgi:hypothetical protein